MMMVVVVVVVVVVVMNHFIWEKSTDENLWFCYILLHRD
jgi:hypothetical protein